MSEFKVNQRERGYVFQICSSVTHNAISEYFYEKNILKPWSTHLDLNAIDDRTEYIERVYY